MIETNNPEIDVNQLMERVRQEAAKVRPRRSHGSPRAPMRLAVLPIIPEMPAPPIPGLSRPLDPKMARTEERLAKARGMIEIGRAIPKMFHCFFRRQGGFNRAALATMNELAKANVQLNKRVRELTIVAEQQNQWLTNLDGQRHTESTWRNAAASALANIPSLREAAARAEEKLAALETFSDGAASRMEDFQSNLTQLRSSLRALQDEGAHSGEHLRNLDALAKQQGEALQSSRDELEGIAEHLRNLQVRTDREAELLRAAREQLDRDGQHLRDLQEHFNQEAAQLRAVREQLERHGEHLRNLQGEAAQNALSPARYANLEAALGRLEDRHLNDSIFIKGELSRHNALLSHRSGPSRNLETVRSEESPIEKDAHRLDSFYLSFENRFRGSRSEIKERVRFYLPVLKEANAGAPDRPILDVGCGRGEWLELLRESGLEGVGVDLNTAMVAQCRERELSVTQADAVEYLRSLPEGSQGAVTGFHIIEHLPLETLIDLVSETRRVLRPGGVAIFESPNCKNLMVGACNFNVDPTHRNPVFPETAGFILETQGFENIRLEYLLPVDSSSQAGPPNESSAWHDLLYGPQDFSVIGRKPFQG